MGKYEQLAKEIVQHAGGVDNITGLTHCITRLRFKLADESRADDEAMSATDGVVTLVKSGGQYQVVIGNHVADVYADVTEIIGTPAAEEGGGGSGSLFDRFIDMISGIFQPILRVMAATGMIKGFNVLFQTLGLYSQESGTYIILNGVGDALFMFLPMFLGFTAAQKFKIRPMVGLVLGAVLCYPALQLSTLSADDAQPLYTLFNGTHFASPVYLTFLSMPVISMDYLSTVIPVIFVVYFASKIEPLFDRIVPEVVKFFFVPMMTILVSAVLGLIIIGPITTFGSTLISQTVLGVRSFSPLLAGAIVGGTWQILMIFGLHWGFIPVYINNIVTLGYDNVMMPFFGASFATTGVVAAVYFRTRNEKLKRLSLPAFISAFFGVTEPAVYGVLLPLRRPFIISCAVSAIVGGFLGAMNLRKFMVGGLSIFELPAMIEEDGGLGNLRVAIIGIVTALVLGFVLTFMLFKERGGSSETDGAQDDASQQSQQDTGPMRLSSPVAGRVIPLAEGGDAAFSSGALGKGVIIDPSEGLIVAPFDGRVTALFPTGHAIGLTADEGQEVLIHIGLDTVSLQGRGFTPKVAQGQRVHRGQELLAFDIGLLRDEGYVMETPVIITNTEDYLDVVAEPVEAVERGQALINIITEHHQDNRKEEPHATA